MKPWSHLPNAHLIDWVIASVKANPEKWISAWDASYRGASYTQDKTWVAAWAKARVTAARLAAAENVARVAAWNAARDAALNADGCLASNTNRIAARAATWNANLALIVYDDCQQYLSMSYEKLLAWATLSERPQAILLLPLKWVQEHECLVTAT